MTRAAERWIKLVADALKRDGHRCRVRYAGCTEIANMIMVMRRLEPPRPDALESDPGHPVRLEELVSACPNCFQRRQPTAEQQVAEQLEDDMGAKPLTLRTWHPVTGEVTGEDRVSNTLDSVLRALDARDELRAREDPVRRAVGGADSR
jgi:hypothetical protein